MESIDIAIIGAGASGLAAAYHIGQQLQKQSREKSIFIFEKNKHIGEEQSGHNSGVDHSRYQHHPKSLKSRLRGCSPISLKQFCTEYGIHYKTVGKLIVATTETELPQLKFYKDNAEQASRETGIHLETELLTSQEVRALEPHVECLAALHTPKTGIVDAAHYVRTLADLVEKQGSSILKEAPVTSLKTDGDGFIVTFMQSQSGEQYEVHAKIVINAAGIYGDELAKKVNPEFPYTIRPLRGEYMKFNTHTRPELAMNGKCVYPVPTIIEGMLDEHGLPKRAAGNHLTPIFGADGNISNWVWVGPLHKVVEGKDNYSENRRTAQEFVMNLPFFPQLQQDDLQEEQTGIQLKFAGYDDWVIERDNKFPNLIHYLEDSPGMSGSLDSSYYLVHHVLGNELFQ